MITKTLLEQEYLLNGKSTRDLANKYGVCQKTIMKNFLWCLQAVQQLEMA